MVQSPTKKRNAARTKASILGAAIGEFSQKGPAGTRVDEIASKAGVNKSLIYQYFGSKQELYAEALSSTLSAITEKAAQHSKSFADAFPEGNLFDVCRQLLENHLKLLEACPEYARLMAWENLEGGQTLARLQMRQTYATFLTRIAGIVKPLNERGLLPEEFNLKHVAQAVMALTHYFLVYQGMSEHLFGIDPKDPNSREQWLDFCTTLFLGSFRIPPDKWRLPDNMKGSAG